MYINYCDAQRALTDDQLVRYLPKKEKKFELSKKQFALSDTTIISQNAVYVLSEYLCGQKCDSLYTYMRFFNDGRVFVSFTYLSYPSKKELSDFSYGKYGRYIVDNEKIKVELYMDRQDGIMYMFARHVSDGIQFYKTSGRGIGQIIKVTRTTDDGYYRKTYTNFIAN